MSPAAVMPTASTAASRIFRRRANKNTILRDGVNDAQVEMAKRTPRMIVNARGGPNPADMLGT